MIEEIREIEALQKIMQSKLPLKDIAQKRFDKKIKLEFTFNSNHMEGNTMTYDETKSLLLTGVRTGQHTLREFVEMSAHDIAFEEIKKWAVDDEKSLTEMDIRDLNTIILVEPFYKNAKNPYTKENSSKRIIVGQYKKSVNGREENGEFKPYTSVEDTPIQMGDLIQWLRDELNTNNTHPIELAALLHYKFVCIHPFDDGNGRISRLLLNYVLLKNNYPPIVIKSDDKAYYINALREADKGNTYILIQYIASLVQWSLQLMIKAADGENIDEPEDLDKKLVLLRKKFGQTAETSIKLRYGQEAFKEAVESIIKPFLDHWEIQLKKFDPFFFSRQTVVSMDNIAKSGIDVFNTFCTLYDTYCSDIHKGRRGLPTFVKCNIDFKRLRLHKSQTSYNGGEISFNFHENVVELIFTNNNKVRNISYTEGISDDEQEEILLILGNFLHTNIETHIERGDII